MLPANERASVRLLGRRPTRVHEETGDSQYAREQARMAAKRAIQEQTEERMIEAFFPDPQQRRMEWLEVARLAREIEGERQRLDKAELASRVALETCRAGAPTPSISDWEAAGEQAPATTQASARPTPIEVASPASARGPTSLGSDLSAIRTPSSARSVAPLATGLFEARVATPTSARGSLPPTPGSARGPPPHTPTSARAPLAHTPASARAPLSSSASARAPQFVVSTPSRAPMTARPSSAVAAAESNLRAAAARRAAEVENEFRDRWEERRTALEESTWFYRGAHQERWRAPDRRTPAPRTPRDARAGGPSIIEWAPAPLETPRRRPATATRDRDEGANARDAMRWEIADAPRRTAR